MTELAFTIPFKLTKYYLYCLLGCVLPNKSFGIRAKLLYENGRGMGLIHLR